MRNNRSDLLRWEESDLKRWEEVKVAFANAIRCKAKWVVAKKKRVPRRRKEEHDSKRWEEVLNGNEGHGDNVALMGEEKPGQHCLVRWTAGSELVSRRCV